LLLVAGLLIMADQQRRRENRLVKFLRIFIGRPQWLFNAPLRRKMFWPALSIFWFLGGMGWYERRRRRYANDSEAQGLGPQYSRQYVPSKWSRPYYNTFNYTKEKLTSQITIPPPPHITPDFPDYPESLLYADLDEDSWEAVYQEEFDTEWVKYEMEGHNNFDRPRTIGKFEWDMADALLQTEDEVLEPAQMDNPRDITWGGPRPSEYDLEIDPRTNTPYADLTADHDPLGESFHENQWVKEYVADELEAFGLEHLNKEHRHSNDYVWDTTTEIGYEMGDTAEKRLAQVNADFKRRAADPAYDEANPIRPQPPLQWWRQPDFEDIEESNLKAHYGQVYGGRKDLVKKVVG
jgi:hypothetical protein